MGEMADWINDQGPWDGGPCRCDDPDHRGWCECGAWMDADDDAGDGGEEQGK